MQLLGDGYEIPEMTKLHGLLRPSRFGQRSASSVDRRAGDSRPRATPARSSGSRAAQRSRATGAPGAGPPLLRVLRHRSSMAATSVGVVKVNAQIATQANPHGACTLARGGQRTCAACRLAHTCGLLASAHVRHRRFCPREADMPIRCLIVDDNSSFRHEMGGLLTEQGFEVVGGAASAAEALQQIAELRPDVALIDIDLGRDSGLTLATRLGETAGPAVPDVILISTHDEGAFAELIERSSALGFLPKTELSGPAIRRMLASATSEANRSGERRGT